MKLLAPVILLALLACRGEEAPQMVENPGPTPGSMAWKLQTARSAAPWSMAANATVAEFVNDSMVILDRGTSGWTCIVDMPETPAGDPVCADSTFMGWVAAYSQNQPPRVTAMGIAYMLQGGHAASDTDPMKMTPDSGAEWLVDPPHLMVVMPNPRVSFATLPTTRTADGPWVMWAGTPYAHLMVPAGSARATAAPAN